MKSKLISSFLVLVASFYVLATPAKAQQAWAQGTCTDGYDGITDVATIQGLECLVGNILATVITIIGIAAFVMFLIGSFSWLTAGNNSKGIEKAKSSITYAIIGIIVALASFIILQFITSFTGVDSILKFNTQIDNVNQGP
jgi:hypothetical protein